MTTSTADPEFEGLLHHLRETRGFDFSAYKRTTLMRRVRKRMMTVGVDGFGGYKEYLEEHQDEFVELFNTVLINVTSFFRDKPAWEYVERELVPRILQRKAPDASIRVWSAGCASGEEAYSACILLAETMGEDDCRRRVKIYATDIDEDALAAARHGIYSARALEPLSAEIRDRYFERLGDRYGFRKDLRRAVIFGRHDLLEDPPISRIDLLISRNTLMYFNSDAQARILARFFYALNEGGYLFLGKAETPLSQPKFFAPDELKYRIFTKPGATPERPGTYAQPVSASDDRSQERGVMRELAFNADSVPQLLVETSMTLAYMNDSARLTFGLSGRDVGRSLRDLDLSVRPIDLRANVERVLNDRRPALLSQVPYATQDGQRWFDVRVTPLTSREGMVLGVSISFHDVTEMHTLAAELESSRNDLETAYEELQSSNEELETTNEELQSTIEELETTNEELQSTNEELETINEELQSTNEELETLNNELRDRGEQVDHANTFLESILTSLKAGVVVVDGELLIGAWNSRAEDLWGLRTDEARGMHIATLDIGFPVEGLVAPIRDCLAGRIDDFEQVYEATNRRGRAISCRVSLRPLREPHGISGVVILMEEAGDGAARGG